MTSWVVYIVLLSCAAVMVGCWLRVIREIDDLYKRVEALTMRQSLFEEDLVEARRMATIMKNQ